MSKKLKIFYIIDISILIVSLLLAIIENAIPQTGLAALESVGRFVVFGIIFIISAFLLVMVSLIYIIKRKIKKKK